MTIYINVKEKALVDSTTGDLVRPACFVDLHGYVSYIESRGHNQKAQEILQRVFDGEKFISKMVDNFQKRQGTEDIS